MEQAPRPTDGELNQIQDEANEFERRRAAGEYSSKELEESLIDPKMTPEEFAEGISASKEGIVFNYLLNRPGTCSHQFPDSKHYNRFKDLIQKGESVDWDYDKSQHASDGSFSLNVSAPGWFGMKGMSTHFHNSEFVMIAHRSHFEGMILRPEFFEKLVPDEGEDLSQADSYIKHVVDLKKAWDEGRKEYSYQPYGISVDHGIRARTRKNGKVINVPIGPEDIDYFYEMDINRWGNRKKIKTIKSDSGAISDLHIKLYRSDGSSVSHEEINHLYDEALRADEIAKQEGYRGQLHEGNY